jgi:hypothetical protein
MEDNDAGTYIQFYILRLLHLFKPLCLDKESLGDLLNAALLLVMSSSYGQEFLQLSSM